MPAGYIEPERADELERLAEVAREAEWERDKAIWEAWSAGISLRTIGEHVGFSHTKVRNIAKRMQDIKDGREPKPLNINYPADLMDSW